MARLLEVKTSVLRFWETEFPQIAPLRTEKGQRLYTEDHINIVRKIHKLLYERGMTIEGAKRIMEETQEAMQNQGNMADNAFLCMVTNELEEIVRLLKPADKK